MPADMSSLVTLVPGAAVLDDLELLRRGLLATEQVGPQELVTLSLQGLDVPPGTTAVQVTDPEGVPLARIALTGSPPAVRGVPQWQAHRSARPFEHLHLAPDALAPVDTVVVADQPFTSSDLTLGPGPALVLVLVSTDDADPHDIAVVRSALAFAGGRPDTSVAIAPLHARASRRAKKRAAVIDAYARAAAVVEPTPAAAVPGDPAGPGVVLFFTGLSGSGKSTIARSVRNRLVEQGRTVTFLDGDLVRRHLSAGLGFTAADRDRNIRRIGWVAAEVAGHGGIAICSPIAPYEQTRADVREMVHGRGGRFLLVHVATPLAECERRDRKGLYARARRGEIPDFTGISAPYETPQDPDLRIDTTGADLAEVRDAVLALLDLDDEGAR